MKTWFKIIPLALGMGGCLLTGVRAQPYVPPSAPASAAPNVVVSDDGTAIQAVQQAADPSAVVAAYGNGLTLNRNNPRLHMAYIGRMVDLGLPELAYHQAESLLVLDPNNGLAHAIIAHVNARRGQMVDAISQINIAASLSSDNWFVQRTAGEIIAWYDFKADKTQIPDNVEDGLARTRDLVDRSTAYTQAYDAATRAYQSQAGTSTPDQSTTFGSAPVQSSQQYQYGQQPAAGEPVEAPLTPPVSYNNYNYYPNDYYSSYGWGPGWAGPSWAWWQPYGYFTGFDFFPFTTGFVFGNDRFFGHDRFFHDRDDRFFRGNRGFGFDHDRGFVNRGFERNNGFANRDFERNNGFANRGFRGNSGFVGTQAFRNRDFNNGFATRGISPAQRGMTFHQSPAFSAAPSFAPRAGGGFHGGGMGTSGFHGNMGGGAGGFHGSGGGHGGGGGGHGGGGNRR